MVVGRRQWDYSTGAHAAVGWLQPHDAAVSGRQANGTSGVGADRGESQSGRNAGGRASRRTSSNAPRAPRIVDLAKEADHRTAAIGEFMQVLLAQNDGARAAETPDNFGVFSRSAIFEQRAGCGGEGSGGIDDVFQSDGNAMQRATAVSAEDFSLRPPGLVESRLGVDCDIGVERWVKLLDEHQAVLGEFDGREIAVAKLSA